MTSNKIKKLKIDDPLDAFAVHGICGIWGTLAVGLLDYERGLFFGHGFWQLGYQCLGIIVCIFWSGILSSLLFFFLKRINWLRIDEDIEIVGIDQCDYGGKAYQSDNQRESDNNSQNVDIDIIDEEI